MATYTGDVYVYFSGFAPIDFGSGVTIDDGDIGGSFVAGEPITSNAASTFLTDDAGTYVGSIDIGGTLYPIVSETNGGSGTLAEDGLYLIVPDDPFVKANLPPDLSGATAAAVPECFLSGTRIATADGECAVEDLARGDMVRTADGGTTPVLWIGKHTVLTRFRTPERLMPVRLKAGALGGGLPHRDLTVTADHALEVDGMLINAGALVNGETIDWVPLSEFGDRFTVYHVETENHDLILAEGAAAETYIDYVQRRAFDNYREYLDLFGEERTIAEMPVPRISAARLVPPHILARLARAAAA